MKKGHKIFLFVVIAIALGILGLFSFFKERIITYKLAESSSTSNLMWRTDISQLTYLQISEQTIIGLKNHQTLLAINSETGVINWEYTIPQVNRFFWIEDVFAVQGSNAVVNIGNEELIFLDLDNGAEKWRTSLANSVDFVKSILIVNDVIVISGQTDLNQPFITTYGLSDGRWIASKILLERAQVASFACDIDENVRGCALITPNRFLAIESTGDFQDISQELPSRYYVYLNTARPQRNWLRVPQEARTNRSYGYDLITQQEYFLEPACNTIDAKAKGLWLVPEASMFFFIDGCGQLAAHPTKPDNWQQPLWKVQIPDLLIDPVIHESEIILLTQGMNLLVYDVETGEQTAQFSFSPQIVVDNAQVVAEEDTIFVYLGRTLFAIKN